MLDCFWTNSIVVGYAIAEPITEQIRWWNQFDEYGFLQERNGINSNMYQESNE